MNTIKQPEDPREPSNMFFLPLPSQVRSDQDVVLVSSSFPINVFLFIAYAQGKDWLGRTLFSSSLKTETAVSEEKYLEGLKVHLRMGHIPYPMALKAIVQKLKQIKIRKLASRLVEGKKAPWNMKKKKRASRKGISHGHQVVEKGGSVVVQRGEVGLSEVWLFGAFDQHMGDGVVRFLQSHLFEEKLQSQLPEEQLSEKQIARKAMETMKNEYNASTPSMQPQERGGSTTVLLVNGERVVAADFGGYKAVLCEGGKAIQLGNRPRKKDIRLWFQNVISEKLFGHGAVDEDENKCKRSLVVDAKKVGSKAEFIILASYGVWEVLRDQEAVDLIRHIEDAQEEAKCLADEAMARMTKSAVTCIVIRFK